ncbi:MAG TPA: DUF1697 domain-containing protein [Rhizomicrobium sp.]|jgi:uncharacterized protein (DUF1697 family)|nr:DUF1697 domain-containing protein [Rhizomicrobium sp.]
MSIQVALLRAINVGGNAIVPMANLRAVVEKAGLRDVRSLLQSGNLIFDANTKTAAATEKLLEATVAKAFGLTTDIFVRSAKEIDAIAAGNPFPKEARNDPGRLVVVFMRQAPAPAAYKALQASIKGRETVRGDGRHAYIAYPDGQGNSKLTAAVITRHLGTPGTARNWNTLLKLAAAASG